MRLNRKFVVSLVAVLTAVLAAAVLSGCTSLAVFGRNRDGAGKNQAGVQPSGVLTGTVAYVERVAIPADARITVQLADTSRADGSATVIAEHRFISAGRQVPLPFELTYDPVAIDPKATYTLQARIVVGGQEKWRSETSYAVLTGGAPASGLAVVVDAVDPKAPVAAPTGLEGRNWMLASFGAEGQEVALPEGVEITAAFSAAASQVAGHSGCNTYFATFTRDGDKLSVRNVGATRMACKPAVMQLETAFLQALETVTAYKVDGDKLQIAYGEDGSVANFVLQ